MSLRGNNHIKPAARRTVVFLLLGAILNVAVAWAACTPLQIKGLPGKAHILRRHDISEHYSHWLAKMPKDFILPSSMNFQSSNIGATRVFASNGGSLNIDSTRCTWRSGTFITAGMPWVCVEGCYWVDQTTTLNPTSTIINASRADWSTAIGNPRSPVVLPYKFLWPGFAINTIFYAAILALLFYGPGKVRRFVRVRRYRCPACAYLIAPGTCASGLCSECGATLPGRLLRPATEGTAA